MFKLVGTLFLVLVFALSAMAQPPTPANLTVDIEASNAIKVSWDDVSGEDGFYVYRSYDGSEYEKIYIVDADTLYYLDFGVDESSTYYYKVSAFNSSGESSPSSAVVGVTKAKSLKRVWLGSSGPYLYDSNAFYNDGVTSMAGVRSEGSILSFTAPSTNYGVIRLGDIGSLVPPRDASYVVVSADGGLTSERIISVEYPLTMFDKGSNDTLFIAYDTTYCPCDSVSGSCDTTSTTFDTLKVNYKAEINGLTLTGNANTNGYWISGDGSNSGITVTSDGYVGINTSSANTILEVNGNAFIGNYSAGEYSEFEADGTYKMNGDATVWGRIEVEFVTGSAGNPNWQSYKAGKSAEFPASSKEIVSGRVLIPGDYKEGSNIYLYFHWSPSVGVNGDVVFGYDYSWANTNDVFPSPTNEEVVESTGTTADLHKVSNFSAISGIGMNIDSVLLLDFYRDGAAASDTYGSEIYLHRLVVVYEKDTVGSRTASGK